MKLRRIEVVEDRTAQSRCDEGFLRLSRLHLRNVYEDGTVSEPYACDVVSRPNPDAVVAVLYRGRGERRIRVFLREAPRAPIYLRRGKSLGHPDARVYDSLQEVVAGMLEGKDGGGEAALRARASAEALEEAGFRCAPECFSTIGEASFASPGTSDEKVFYTAGDVDGAERGAATGDGSVMEEGGELVERDLAAAIAACRSGEIPDMKTEIALLRLAEHLGYIPQLDCFVEDLPAALRARYRTLGVAASRGADADREGGA